MRNIRRTSVPVPSTTEHEFTMHLMDAARMRADIDNLKANEAAMNSRVLSAIGDLAGEIKAMRESVQLVPRQISDCRSDMRREVERDFPAKTDAINMERRIEDKISDTDKTLGLQIAAVGKKSSDDIQSLKDQITTVETKVDRQWLRITVIVTTVVAVGGIVQWFFMAYHALPLQ